VPAGSRTGFPERRRPHDSVRAHDFSGSIPTLPSAADDGEVHPAVVRRRTGGLDGLPAFLSGLPARGLRLCARAVAVFFQAHTGDDACGIARGRAVLFADRAGCALGAANGREPYRADSAAVDGLPGAAVLCAFFDRAAVAGVVQPMPAGRDALPLVCAFQRRFVVGADQLPVCLRAGVDAAGAGRNLGLEFRSVCPALRRLCVAAVASGASGKKIGCVRSRDGRLSAHGGSQRVLVRAAGLRVGAVAGNDQQVVSGCAVHSVFVGFCGCCH
jgi:hypothetical protein